MQRLVTHRQAVVVTVNQVYKPIVTAVTAAKSHPNFHDYALSAIVLLASDQVVYSETYQDTAHHGDFQSCRNDVKDNAREYERDSPVW